MNGAKLRDEGITLVMQPEELWTQEITAAFVWWLRNAAPAEFTFEQFRMFVQSHGVQEPHHPNVWGGLAKRFAGLVETVGYTTSIRPEAHARLTRTYRRAQPAHH